MRGLHFVKRRPARIEHERFFRREETRIELPEGDAQTIAQTRSEIQRLVQGRDPFDVDRANGAKSPSRRPLLSGCRV